MRYLRPVTAGLGVNGLKIAYILNLHSPNIVYNLVTLSRGNRLQYYVPAQVGEPDAFWKHGKSTRAKIHSIAMTACSCPRSTGP